MSILEKIGNFFSATSPVELVVLAILFLIPVLAVVVLIVGLVNAAKRRREEAAVSEEADEPEEQESAVEPYRSVSKTEASRSQTVMVYVPEASDRPSPKRERVSVKYLKKADKTLLAATAIFCIGLGAMIHHAVSGNRH